MVVTLSTIGTAPRVRTNSSADQIAGATIRHRNIAGSKMKAIAARAIGTQMVARTIKDRRIAGRRRRPQMLSD